MRVNTIIKLYILIHKLTIIVIIITYTEYQLHPKKNNTQHQKRSKLHFESNIIQIQEQLSVNNHF